jgi:hypothetical protein
MAHTVEVTLTSQPLSREETGVEFVVESSDGKFGELLVSKGGLRWRPKGKHDHHFIGWEDLDDMMRGRPRR